MIFGQIKTYAWQAAALALLATALTQTVRLASAKNAHAQTVAAFNAATAKEERQAREQSEKFRDLEGKHRDETDQIRADAQTALAAATADAGRARAAGQRLRGDLAAYIEQHRSAAIARAAAGECTPDTSATTVLADLFRRADDRAGELAAIADEARARGNACQRAYDSARTMSQAAGAH
ncbi:DUF2514 domain-containing protein [Acidovorax sp. GBBC 3334]|uniref:DUF2514 family protein n=1 Tax=Acidovorax sp. GBBC 3334 TaxID=2940496 RepID=UPI00230338FD|nr:DUF2514 family protein [Acidovorax sp. GBBC 3334]MDA8455252.1 DUF2514 domain-containing protein [Acidovorax sp. GBBC 3334]